MENPLLRRPRLPESESNRYAKMGLRDNPFPSEPALVPDSPDPRLNGDIYCAELHESNTTQFEELLIPRGGDPARPLVFLMDYASHRGRGIGKTAFLKHRRDDVMKDFGGEATGGDSVLFAEHLIPRPTPPCRKFWQFCRLAVNTLSAEVIPCAMWRVRAFTDAIPDEVTEQLGPHDDWERSIGNRQWLEEHDVNVEWELNPAVTNRLQTAGMGEEWARKLARRSWGGKEIQGIFQEVSDYSWRREGAALLFDELVKLFRAAEFSRGLLLVDELEKIVVRQNAQERRAFVESLRYYMFDGDCAAARRSFYGTLLTIHPGVQELLLPHWNAAGLDRLAPLGEPDADRCTLYFKPLDRSQATPLVTVYLDCFRINDEDKGRIAPFTEEALGEALVRSSGVPGVTLSLLHEVVESAAKQGSSKIDKQLVEDVYGKKHSPVPDEPEVPNRLPRSQVDLMEDE